MAKRYIKGKHYTLCLLKQTKTDDIDTWCVNVTFIAKINNLINFQDLSGNLYLYNEETHTCYISEFDYTPIDIVCVTNIVSGWQLF